MRWRNKRRGLKRTAGLFTGKPAGVLLNTLNACVPQCEMVKQLTVNQFSGIVPSF